MADDEPTIGRLPTVEELEQVHLRVVSLFVHWKWRLVFKVEPVDLGQYQPFDIVFDQPRSFTGAAAYFRDVRLCFRGPSPAEDGALVFEFETRAKPPAPWRFFPVAAEVKARVVAASVAVQEIFRCRTTFVTNRFFASNRGRAELEAVLRDLAEFEIDLVERSPGIYRLTATYPRDVQEAFRRDAPRYRKLAAKFDPRIDALIARIGGTPVEADD